MKVSFLPSFFCANSNTFDSPISQRFSIPLSVISYIIKNPITAEGLVKLQQACKYFFIEHKIVVISEKRVYQDVDDLFCYDIYKERKYYFKNFNNDIKFWLTKNLCCRDKCPINNAISSSIYRCSLYSLALAHQTLTLNEIYFLINGGKLFWLELTYLTIDEKNLKESTFIDRVLEKLPHLSHLYYDCKNEVFSSRTFEKMNSLVFESDYKNFKIFICNLATDADVTLLCKFFQNNADEVACDFEIGFCITENNEYVAILQSALNNLLQTWSDGEKHEISIL